jgi:hypothetical protein
MARIRIMVMAQHAKGQKDECFGKCKFEEICGNLGNTGTGPRCSYIPLLYISDFLILGVRNG